MNNTSYVPLEGKITEGLGIPSATFSVNQAISFASSTSLIYSLLVIACVGAAGFVYIKGGLLRMQASESGIRKSNEEFKRGTIGLLGVLSLFLILYTINKSLLSADIGLGALKLDNTTATNPASGQQVNTGTNSVTNTNTSTGSGSGWDAIKNDPAVRAQLAALPNGGISINREVCSNPTQTVCTTVGGLPQSTISMLTELRNTCPGKIRISGGTEAGHSSHGPGLKPVDISLDPTLDSCIGLFLKSSKIPKRQDDSNLCHTDGVFTKFGYTFCNEIGAPHWHVY